ncbi:MAG: TrmH family RNA methyltransferase [Hahellaceae bacterium]|nr:TrmH family RNA methyltransferase [Hahellaceae bacterium]
MQANFRGLQFSADTKQTCAKIPVTAVDDLFAHIPEGARIIAVELTEGAIPLMDFQHPELAYYLFGPEDNSISQDLIERCDYVVYIPTVGCMNLAATVNVVLYDRLCKSDRQVIADRPIVEIRDNRNRTRC